MGEVHEAMIKIKQQMVYQQDDPMEFTLNGTYEERDGRHRIAYTEFDMEDAAETQVVLDFDDENIIIRKTGHINTVMTIDCDGGTAEGVYQTPYGTFPMKIISKRYDCIEIRGLFILELEYRLLLSSRLVGDNRMKISALVRRDYGHEH